MTPISWHLITRSIKIIFRRPLTSPLYFQANTTICLRAGAQANANSCFLDQIDRIRRTPFSLPAGASSARPDLVLCPKSEAAAILLTILPVQSLFCFTYHSSSASHLAGLPTPCTHGPSLDDESQRMTGGRKETKNRIIRNLCGHSPRSLDALVAVKERSITTFGLFQKFNV